MAHLMIGAFYNPIWAPSRPGHRHDHLAMADPRAPMIPGGPGSRPLHPAAARLPRTASRARDERAIERARSLAELYRSPWVAEHFQCLHTEDGTYNLNYVFPPLYTEEFLERFVANANALKARLDQPLIMENIPGFFDVTASRIPEAEWLRRFFERTDVGFLLDLPHVWLDAHYHGADPKAFLAEFPLERVVELHVAGVEQDADLRGPWIAPTAPSDDMLEFMAHAVAQCPHSKAVTFDAFSPSLTADVLLASVERIRKALDTDATQ
jgi:uncharacterized protein (UPF0276 family)